MTLLDAIIFADSVFYNMTGLLIVGLGMFVSLRVTGFPDLTADGSFTIGAVLYAISIASGLDALVALGAATAGGLVAGAMTWAVNHGLGVGKIISGVLVMIILILVSPYFSGGSTQSLLNKASFFEAIAGHDRLLSRALLGSTSYQLHLLFSLIWLGAAVGAMLLVWSSLRTRLGLTLRYLGGAVNPTLTASRGRGLFVCVGLAAGNGLVAIGGAVEAERRGGFTVNMGTGIILVGITVLLLGEGILRAFRRREFLTVPEYLVAATIGAFVYSAGVQLILVSGVGFVDLRLMTAFFLLLLLGLAGHYHSNSSKLF